MKPTGSVAVILAALLLASPPVLAQPPGAASELEGSEESKIADPGTVRSDEIKVNMLWGEIGDGTGQAEYGIFRRTSPFPSSNSPLQVVPGEHVRDELGKLPGQRLREQIEAALDMTKQESCSIAAKEWMLLLIAMGGSNPRVSLEQILAKARRENAGRFTLAAQVYDSACLTGADRLPSDLRAARVADLQAFILQGTMPVCSAARVEADLFVTARHCFFHPVTGRRLQPPETLGVQLLGGMTGKQYRITELPALGSLEDQAAGSFSISDDFIYFRTEQPGESMPPLKVDFGRSDGPLVLLGYFRFHNAEAAVASGGQLPADADWRSGLRWSDSGLCTWADVSESCKIHFCQTDAQFSGAPVFQRALDSGTIVLSGIHVASMGSDTGCGFNRQTAVGNVAVRPSSYPAER